MKKVLTTLAGAAAFSLLATPALAHPGHVESGFMSGLAHPFTGLDHLLAMLAVGFVAFKRGNRFLGLPLAFMGFMVLGALLGFADLAVPQVEMGVAGSVLVLGLMLAFSKQLPFVASALVTGLFAIFHGHAHATEMTQDASALVYMTGFVMGTGILHALGFSLGAVVERALKQAWIAPTAGLGTAGVGAAMLMGWL